MVSCITEKNKLLVLANRVLRKLTEHMCGELTGDLGKRHTKAFYVLSYSQNSIRVTKSKRAKWVCRVTRVLKGSFWQENLKGTYHL
jgi:hypothetical protein